MKNLQIMKFSEFFEKIGQKTVLFRKIARIFSLEKPCYLENRVVREPCKRRSACSCLNLSSFFAENCHMMKPFK